MVEIPGGALIFVERKIMHLLARLLTPCADDLRTFGQEIMENSSAAFHRANDEEIRDRSGSSHILISLRCFCCLYAYRMDLLVID